MSSVDPVVSIVIGAVAFGESIRHTVVASAAEALSMAVMVLGVFMLAQTTAVMAANEAHAGGLSDPESSDAERAGPPGPAVEAGPSVGEGDSWP
jgi:hypothetical protein